MKVDSLARCLGEAHTQPLKTVENCPLCILVKQTKIKMIEACWTTPSLMLGSYQRLAVIFVVMTSSLITYLSNCLCLDLHPDIIVHKGRPRGRCDRSMLMTADPTLGKVRLASYLWRVHPRVKVLLGPIDQIVQVGGEGARDSALLVRLWL